MSYLNYEEKLTVKELAEKSPYISKNKEKNNLLKGSLDIKQQDSVEKLLGETECYYLEKGKKEEFKEAKKYCIGKVIVILKDDGKTIIEVISLKDYDSGIGNFKDFVENMNQEYMKNFGKEESEKERLEALIDKFKSLKKHSKIEKGKVLEEIDNILTENRELSKKTEMWKELGILPTYKSMLCKRHNLFEELQKGVVFSGSEDLFIVIEKMTDAKLKEITKEDVSMEDKESIIFSLIYGKEEDFK